MGVAVLPVDLRVLEYAMCLPEGYRLRDAHCDVRTGRVDFLVESDAIPTQEHDEEMPRVQVIHTVEHLPEHPEYRKIIGKVTIDRHKRFGYPSGIEEYLDREVLGTEV